MLTLLTFVSLFALARAAPRAMSASTCVGAISSLDDVDEAVKCDTVQIHGFTVDAGKTFSLNLFQGTTVDVLGDISFGNGSWDGILFELIGEDITFKGNGKRWDGGGPYYWDGQGASGGNAKPKLMMNFQMTGKVSNVKVFDSPTRAVSLDSSGPLLVEGVTVDDSQGDSPNDQSNGKPAGRNTDGFDVSGHNITLKNSKVINQDDCVAISKGSDILIENVTCLKGHGISIGSIRSNVVVENVVFKENKIFDSEQAFRIKTDKTATNSRVSNILYSGNTAKNCKSYGVLITQSYPDSLGTPGNGVKISNITFTSSDVTDVAVEEEAERITLDCGTDSCGGDWNWNGLKVTGGKGGSSVNGIEGGCKGNSGDTCLMLFK